MSLPRQLRTQTGRSIVLANELGKGGEGVVYEVHGNDHVAAKIYHRDKAADRSEKIEAIVRAEWHKVSSSVAFPIDSLFTASGQFVGFTMPRVAGNKPIHDLYSPTSRKTAFPNASFRFLLRTALNIACGLASVHATGCVVGDINHSGILISNNALATLIDCDSFQIQVGGKAFLCKVGVPDFTPPELQGKRLDQFIRTPNHDAFGLAIVLFNLLFMGRHPFAGRFLGRGDIPLEMAIAQYRFAYSARRNETQTEPPPNVPLLSDVPQAVAHAFEIAFGQIGVSQGRPKAVDWANILQDAEGEIIQCASSPAHHHFRTATACPWCRMEAAYPGFLAFAPPLISVSSTPTNLGQLIAAIRGVPDPGVAPALPAMMPAFKGKASQSVVQAKKQTVRNYAAALITAVVSVVLFQLQYSIIGLVALAGSVFLATRRSTPEEVAQKLIDQSTAAWSNVEVKWNQANNNHNFLRLRLQADQLITELHNLGDEEARRISDLKARERDTQLMQFLQQFYIGKASIKGIGRNRKIILRAYGIETAADVEQHRIQQISGFGSVIAGNLVAWRKSIERKFVFKPNQPISPIELSNIKEAIKRKSSELDGKLRQSFSQLQRTSNEILAIRNSLQTAAVQICNTKKQAELDKLAITNGFSMVPRLAGIGGVIVAAFALFQSFQTTTKASVPTAGKIETPTITKQVTQNPPQPSSPLQGPAPAIQWRTESLGGDTPTEAARGPLSNSKSRSVQESGSTTNSPPSKGQHPAVETKSATLVHSARPPTSTDAVIPQQPDQSVTSTTTIGAPLDLTSTAEHLTREGKVSPRPETLNREEMMQMQARLRELGFLSTVDGLWNQRTQEALRQFKIANHLSSPDLWDLEAQEKLKSPGASRAYQSFIGSWSDRPCRPPDLRDPPLIINSRRARSFEGGVCEFTDIDPDDNNWHVRAICTVSKKRWTANITFAVRGNQLTWGSERGVTTYYRCI
jgi:DNA-binding helix-hairpin-helix protein with protein kinase domain